MNTATVVHMEAHPSHGHFYQYTEFGDHLPVGPSLEDVHKENMKKLRHQFLHDTNVEESTPTLPRTPSLNAT
jgi:hypothetical protein